MTRIVSDRAGKTDQVVLLPSSLEDPRSHRRDCIASDCCRRVIVDFRFLHRVDHRLRMAGANPAILGPDRAAGDLWLSTALILASSVTFEAARRVFRRGTGRPPGC